VALVEFVDPPGMARRFDWKSRLAVVRKKPGMWAALRAYDTSRKASIAAYWLKHESKAIPFGERWSVMARQGIVYARYDGKGEM
jgi:hypothetical protein